MSRTHTTTEHDIVRTMFSTRHDLPLNEREQMVDLLNQQLADTFDLYSQAKQAHWNVKGMDFFQLHKLFDELAEMLEEHIDVIAERVTALGGMAMGTARMAAAASTLPEIPHEVVQDSEVVDALAARCAAYAASTRQAIDLAEEAGDMATNDLFIDVVRGVDKFLYFLEAHQQRPPV